MEHFILEFSIRAALIVLTAALVLRVLRIKSAAAQHSVWVGVLMAMLLLPAWLAWGPKAGMPVLPPQGESAVVINMEVPAPPMPLETPVAPSPKPPVWNWSAVLLGIYGLGAFVLLLRLAIGTIRASRLTSASCVAPVTVGPLRPRIILPASSSGWSRAQLDAVLTHERAHTRRRDPLFQWLALFNRAVFWFHPLAWWLERKLSALAEEACDAAVLERGHDPREYSQYLLELARAVQRAGTRVNVVAMAMPGSALPQRVEKIIAGVRAPKLSRAHLALTGLACAIPAVLFAAGTLDHIPQALPLGPLPMRPAPQPPVLLAQAPAPAKAPEAPGKLEFEVASVKPMGQVAGGEGRGGGFAGGMNGCDGSFPRVEGNRFVVTTTPFALITWAYGYNKVWGCAFTSSGDLITGGPPWIRSERFEIQALVPEGATIYTFDEFMKGDAPGLEKMLQSLLADRFKLVVRHVTKEVPGYALVPGKGGPKLQTSAADDQPAMGVRRLVDPSGQIANKMVGRKMEMRDLAFLLVMTTHRPVLDRTGLTGQFNFDLDFAPFDADATADSSAPSLFTAIQEQLGLRLDTTKAPLDGLVIEGAERPSEN